ncbi:class I SAM-dependent methyltransferase [Corynebacterium sp. 335C]
MPHHHNLRADWSTTGPRGVVTRGTTNANRLRRADRWLAHHPDAAAVLRRAEAPLAVDLGYGASHVTTCEWARHLRRVDPRVRVVGLEIEPSRVLPPRDGVEFALGGFELAGLRPHLVRAFNVLRQYDAGDVDDAWREVCGRLAPGGLFLEGTCDEIGRRATWILLGAEGPRTLTLAWDPNDVERPSDLAERLPKVLIHRNAPGEPVHDLLAAADRAWDMAAGWAPHGPRQRWRVALESLAAAGEPVAVPRRAGRDNVLTVPVARVAPEYADGFG